MRRPDNCPRIPGAPDRPTLPRRSLPLAVCLFLLAASAILAQSNAAYDLSWSTVDGGGATWLTGGGYVLGGTAGQPDAGLLAGGEYMLGGGFWAGGAAAPPPQPAVYLPLVMRNH